MEQLIQVIIVITFFTMGISMALRPKLWKDWVSNIERNGVCAVLSLGLINLLLGAIIVTFHWVWEGFAMIVTIIGIIMLCRSFVMLLVPSFVLKMIKYITPQLNILISILGFFAVIISVLLLHELEVQSGVLAAPQGLYSLVQN